jgi:hypothetical protein
MKLDNLTTRNLRRTLARVFFEEDDDEHLKYVVPLNGNWLVPTTDPRESVSTWIGYQIASIRPIATSVLRGDVLLKNCTVRVRVWAVGEQAEAFITSTLFWDERADVRERFERNLGRLIEGGREVVTQVYEQEGLNDTLCWITDITLAAYFGLDRQSGIADGVEFVGNPVIRNIPTGAAQIPTPPAAWSDPYKVLFEGGEDGA